MGQDRGDPLYLEPAIRHIEYFPFVGVGPKIGKVSYEGKDKDGKSVKVTYMRSELGSQPDVMKNEVETAFINDNYELLFPLKVYWDNSATVIEQGMYNLPVGSGSAELVAVKYPAEGGGSTPGDTWELYFRQRQPSRVPYVPPRQVQEAKPILRNVGRPQKGRPSADLDGPSRQRRWQADTGVVYGRGGQGHGSDTWVDAK